MPVAIASGGALILKTKTAKPVTIQNGGKVRSVAVPYGNVEVCSIRSEDGASYLDLGDVPGGVAVQTAAGAACRGTILWGANYLLKSYQPAH